MNKSRFVIFTFLTLISFFLCAQTQIGSDIRGIKENDGCGVSVAISDDGKIVALGSPGDDGNGSNSGHVRVLKI